MRNYTYLQTSGTIRHRERGLIVDIWVHDDKIMKNRTHYTENELRVITDDFEDMDAINERDVDLETMLAKLDNDDIQQYVDEDGYLVEPKESKFVYLLIRK